MTAVVGRWLLWISAKNRETGLTERSGFWTGADAETFVVGGQARLYHAAGSLLQVGEVTYEKGLTVQQQRVSLSILTPEVATAIRIYDPRRAPAELHLATFDPDTMQLRAIRRMFKGVVNTSSIGEGGSWDVSDATCELTLVSSSREGTDGLTSLRSDASMRKRDPDDRFRRFTDISGAIPVVFMGDSDGDYKVRRR